MTVRTCRHGAFVKSSTYCLVIQSHTQWLISSQQEMWEKPWKQHVLWVEQNTPRQPAITTVCHEMPHLLQILYFLQAVSSSSSATQIVGFQYEAFNRVSFPALHMFCVSAYIKAVELREEKATTFLNLHQCV